MPCQVVQLTDLHLLADPAERRKGVPTRETLRDVLELVRSRHPNFDLAVFSGDLAHDERLETYHALRELLEDWLPRCRFLPGNHDDRRFLRSAFPDVVDGGRGPIGFADDLGEWRILGLDTHVAGEVRGRIDEEQLDWLEADLAEQTERPTLIFMHHPPISVNSAWLDRLGLDDAERFEQLVLASGQVKLICAGHVHHEFHGRLGQADVYTTPSTGVQFEPAADEPTYAAEPPGYRVITLDGRSYRTEVVRLPELKYPPTLDDE